MSISVLMFPARGNRDENRFIDVLATALRQRDLEVRNWHKSRPWQQADIFHVHWPEVIADIARRPWQNLRGRYIAWNLLDTARRVRKAGGCVVWTVHDLQPHDARLRQHPFCRQLLERFASLVDVFVSLTEAGVDPIRRTWVRDATRPVLVARHPHYRDVLEHRSEFHSSRVRTSMGIAADAWVLSALGSMRPNKRISSAAAAFRGLRDGEAVLVLAGTASAKVRAEIECAIQNAAGVITRFERIPQAQLLDYYGISDLALFPATGYFNSGTIYTTLSLNVPVLVEDCPQNREIQDLVGDTWVHLFDGELSTASLKAAVAQLQRPRDRGPCPMTAFDPRAVAIRHVQIYEAALHSQRVARRAPG
jgi:hypothetical protein